jgi:hypothetical protein
MQLAKTTLPQLPYPLDAFISVYMKCLMRPMPETATITIIIALLRLLHRQLYPVATER